MTNSGDANMADDAGRSRLGRGLAALMGDVGEETKKVGKSRSHVANTLRLLKLPQSVQDFIGAGKISAGHARMLIGQPDPERLAREIMERGLNVRQVEALAQERAHASGKSSKARQR